MTDKEFSELRKISQIKPMDLSAAKAYQDLEAKTANIYMLSGMTLDDIVYHLMKGDVFVSLDFINRQKAEIERLKTENHILSQKRINFFERIEIITAAEVRSVKKFAETLKVNYSDFIGDCYYEDSFRAYIDNYVKEMEVKTNAPCN